MIGKIPYRILLFMLAGVFLLGLGVTLFENDSAQFAVMAMRMVQEGDFINLFKGPEEYLDKPHLHYWLAALSYLVFGIEDWAYRIPALLLTALAAYSCFGLGKVLYNRAVGLLAALIFLSSQTIVLAGIDVRTDAVLTGFTAFAIWQLATYVANARLLPLLFGALGAGLAFSTKGQIALLVIGLPLLCHLAYTRKWQLLFHWKVVLALGVFALAISPMLYAYYQQFDLHPEKVIRGRSGRSGILFIFWEQSFERLSGEGVGKNSSDYFFFFHTFLWVFLPWTVIGLLAFWDGARRFVKSRMKQQPNFEILTLGGIASIFILISFAQFKLPHYLNITIPLFAVLTAAYMHRLYKDPPAGIISVLLGVQYAIFGAVLLFAGLVCFWVFPASAPVVLLILAILVIALGFLALRHPGRLSSIIWLAAMASVMLNTLLNLHFYPSLLAYQGGSAMARIVAQEGIPATQIYKISERHTWALDFYNRDPVNITGVGQLQAMTDVWVYANGAELQLIESAGLAYDRKLTVDQFRITRLQARFLNPGSREEVLEEMHLIHLP